MFVCVVCLFVWLWVVSVLQKAVRSAAAPAAAPGAVSTGNDVAQNIQFQLMAALGVAAPPAKRQRR